MMRDSVIMFAYTDAEKSGREISMRILMLAVMLCALGACSNPVPDLKSPCVGTDDSPCVRRPVNA